MTTPSIKRILGYVFCFVLFAASAWLGLSSGRDDFAESHTALQVICSVAVMLYGIFGFAAGVGLLLRRHWSVIMTVLWGAATVVAAVIAPLAWAPGETPCWGVALGGIMVAGIAVLTWRIVRALLRPAGFVTGAAGSESRNQ